MDIQAESTRDERAQGMARVAVTCVKIRRHTKEENLAEWLKAVDKAGAVRPDVIVLSETVYERGCGLKGSSLGEPIPGRLTEALAGKARQYAAHIAFSMYERAGESIYNTAVLLGRDGRIEGLHRKTFLAIDEDRAGIRAGAEFRAFSTDIGRIGLMVCKELSDQEIPRKLKALGAQLILAPTIGDYGRLYPGIARDNAVWLAVSGQDCASTGAHPSVIVNPKGETVGSTSDESCVTGEYGGSGGSFAWADIPIE